MCIAEIHPRQHKSTMQWANFHNLATVSTDLKTFVKLLKAQGHLADALAVESLKRDLDQVVEEALDLYGMFVASAKPADFDGEVLSTERHQHDVRNAAAYETRREVTEEEVAALQAR